MLFVIHEFLIVIPEFLFVIPGRNLLLLLPLSVFITIFDIIITPSSTPGKTKGSPLHTLPSDRSLARAALVGLIVIAAAVCLSIPGQSAWLPSCIFYKLTGLYCPGCGSTRMLFSLLHGHPVEALRYNPLSLLVLSVILYSLIRKSFDLRLPALPRVTAPWLTAFAVAIVLFTVARNIPAEPFCKLAPGSVCRLSIGAR